LNKYLLIEQDFDLDVSHINQNGILDFTITDSLTGNPELKLYAQNMQVATEEWKTEKTKFLPKLSISYKWQNIDGVQGFYGWQAGINVPLLFFEQSGKTKASHINVQIAQAHYHQKQLDVTADYQQQINRYLMLKEVNDYYEAEALPLAQEQMTAANLAYKWGSIDYVEFMQSMESGIHTQLEYLYQRLELFALMTEIQQLLGNQQNK